MFNPTRLRIARKRRKLNKTAAASLIGVDLRTITAYESGEFEPSAETLEMVARKLKFPIGFFSGCDLHEPLPETASFRSRARMSATNRDAALSSGSLAFHLNDFIESKFTLPSTDVLDLRGEDPETAAMTVRQQWGLGERPVRNMVHLLEAKGVRVYSMVEDTTDMDAFSLWREATPFVFLNTLKSAEHGRFDAAHELGHLILHRHDGPLGKTVEREADAFASAFLMPRGSILAHAPVLPNLNTLINLKQHWIVSVAALAYRLHTLNLLSDWHYRSLCIEMSKRGYRTKEPSGAQRELSALLKKIFAELREDGVTRADLAERLEIGIEELDKLVFGLILLGLPGGGNSRDGNGKKTLLHIVE